MTGELPQLHGAQVMTHVSLFVCAKFAVILNITFRAGVRNFWAHSKNKNGGPVCNSPYTDPDYSLLRSHAMYSGTNVVSFNETYCLHLQVTRVFTKALFCALGCK
jgi:hypothetical protein